MTAPQAGGEKLVRFAIAGQPFAVAISAVKETVPTRPLTRVPLVPDVVAGLYNLRGEVVAVLDLPRLLGLPPSGAPQHVVMLRSQRGGKGGERIAAGLLVESLDGVCTLDGAPLRPPPPTLSPETAAYLVGVGTLGDPPRPLPVLSAEKIVACPALAPFARPRSP